VPVKHVQTLGVTLQLQTLIQSPQLQSYLSSNMQLSLMVILPQRNFTLLSLSTHRWFCTQKCFSKVHTDHDSSYQGSYQQPWYELLCCGFDFEHLKFICFFFTCFQAYMNQAKRIQVIQLGNSF